MSQTTYPRDMKGYGRAAPHPHWPGEARIAVRSVQVSKPSLDEVFLTLTGRPVEEHDADDDAATSEGRVA